MDVGIVESQKVPRNLGSKTDSDSTFIGGLSEPKTTDEDSAKDRGAVGRWKLNPHDQTTNCPVILATETRRVCSQVHAELLGQ